MERAIQAGHSVTAYVRNPQNLTPSLLALSQQPASLLTLIKGELQDEVAVQQAIRRAKPHVVYGMLASDAAPHTQVSTSVRLALKALGEGDEKEREEEHSLKNTRLIIIGGWGELLIHLHFISISIPVTNNKQHN